jgi:hypothetical protein
MKKISTLKVTEVPVPVKTNPGFGGEKSEASAAFEPDAQVISNILNYSKALSVKKSAMLEHIVTVNN